MTEITCSEEQDERITIRNLVNIISMPRALFEAFLRKPVSEQLLQF
jgi:hypothetical protein